MKCLASLSLTRSMGFSWPLAGFLLPQPKQKSTSERPHLWFLFPLSAVGYPGNESVASTCPPQSPSRNSFCLHYQTVGLQSNSRKSLLDRNGQRSGEPVLVGFLQRSAGSKAKLGQSRGHEGCSYCACVVTRWRWGGRAYSYSIQ